jgi:hypothetical protein
VSVAAIVLLAAVIIALRGGSARTPASPAHGTGDVTGTVTVAATHLGKDRYHFDYTVRNTGRKPIGGFQINASRVNLYDVSGPPGWSYYGSGVCGGKHGIVLIYWSAGPVTGTPIRSAGHARFSFDVNTDAIDKQGHYSISWDEARPSFGPVSVPAPRTSQAPRPCPSTVSG